MTGIVTDFATGLSSTVDLQVSSDVASITCRAPASCSGLTTPRPAPRSPGRSRISTATVRTIRRLRAGDRHVAGARPVRGALWRPERHSRTWRLYLRRDDRHRGVPSLDREWFVRELFTVQFGDPGDLPQPGDYNGDGTKDLAVYRPSTGQWFVRNQFAVQFGGPGYRPVSGDYDGDGDTDVARVSAADRHVVRSGSVHHPVRRRRRPAGSRRLQQRRGRRTSRCIAGRPASGSCATSSRCSSATLATSPCRTTTTATSLGRRGGLSSIDRPVVRAEHPRRAVRAPGMCPCRAWRHCCLPLPGDYDGNGTTDIAVYRPSTWFWFVRGSSP